MSTPNKSTKRTLCLLLVNGIIANSFAATVTYSGNNPLDWESHVINGDTGDGCGRLRATITDTSLVIGDSIVVTFTGELESGSGGGAFGAFFVSDNNNDGTGQSTHQVFTINAPSTAGTPGTYNQGSYRSDGTFTNLSFDPSPGQPSLLNGNVYTLTYTFTRTTATDYTIDTVLIDDTAGSDIINTTDGNPATGTGYSYNNPGFNADQFNITLQQEDAVCYNLVIPEPSTSALVLISAIGIGLRRSRKH